LGELILIIKYVSELSLIVEFKDYFELKINEILFQWLLKMLMRGINVWLAINY
jgi:hypothetical protein